MNPAPFVTSFWGSVCGPTCPLWLMKAVEACLCNIWCPSFRDICGDCVLTNAHMHGWSIWNEQVGPSLCQGLVMDAAILSSRCNWATETRTQWLTPRAPPLPCVKVHASSLWLLHRLSNCMPKHVCVYVSECVCARVYLRRPGQTPRDMNSLLGCFIF